jgi:RHS repeat-associated protein
VWQWDNIDPFADNAPVDNPSGFGSFNFNLRFPGQYFDVETGTHYNYFRDYDPRIARYIESDPVGLRGGLNSYSFVDSSPINFVDPKGLAKKPGPEYIYDLCSDTQILRCVESCRAQGRVYQDCTQLYIKMPGVNGGKETFKGSTCVCRDPDPAPNAFRCGPDCQRTFAIVGAIVFMICTRVPIPIP